MISSTRACRSGVAPAATSPTATATPSAATSASARITVRQLQGTRSMTDTDRLAAGMNDYIAKPIDQDELLSTVSNLLSNA